MPLHVRLLFSGFRVCSALVGVRTCLLAEYQHAKIIAIIIVIPHFGS